MNLDEKYSLAHLKPVLHTVNEEGTIEIVFKGGTKEQVMVSGLKKRVYPDGLILLTM